MENKCRFCAMSFKAIEQDENICSGCKDSVIKVLQEDVKLKYEFLEAILKDKIILERIAKEVFTVPAKCVGIGGDGDLATFFRTRKRTPS